MPVATLLLHQQPLRKGSIMARPFRPKDVEDVEEAAKLCELVTKSVRQRPDYPTAAAELDTLANLQRKRAGRLRKLAERMRAAIVAEGAGE